MGITGRDRRMRGDLPGSSEYLTFEAHGSAVVGVGEDALEDDVAEYGNPKPPKTNVGTQTGEIVRRRIVGKTSVDFMPPVDPTSTERIRMPYPPPCVDKLPHRDSQRPPDISVRDWNSHNQHWRRRQLERRASRAEAFVRQSEADTTEPLPAVVADKGCATVIEFCTNPNSNLGRVAADEGFAVQRLTAETDMSQSVNLTKVKEAIKSLDKVALWASPPCTAWSTWQRINSSRGGADFEERITKQRGDSLLLIRNFKILAKEVIAKEGLVFFEWPALCDGWRNPNV